MTKKREIIILLTFSIVLAFFLGFGGLLSSKSSDYSYNNNYRNDEFIIPKISDSLAYSDVQQNVSTVYRIFESINFTVDTSDFSNTNYTIMQISFLDGSIRNYDMLSVGINEFYYEYKPEYNAPLGRHNVSFLLYNVLDTLLNDHTTYTNFTILSNCAIFDLEPEYYTWDTLSAGLMVHNFSNPIGNFDFEEWDITIVDSDNESTQNNLVNLESNINQVNLLIDNETFKDVNKIYYIKINMTELNRGIIRAAYFPFNIRNYNPNITSIIDLSPDEIFRTDICTISLNATDIESLPSNLAITMYVQDAEGEDVLEELIPFDSGNSYSDTFSIPANRPAGKYRINVTARDEDGGETSKITFLTVKNNPPEIHNYWVNGLSDDTSISVRYGENLIFSFNVSDAEGISYIKIALLSENYEWYNISRVYEGASTIITVRTAELITGTWFVYIYVIDSDGEVISLIDDYGKAPQGVSIIPDVLSEYLPWILFFVGISLGVLLGVGSMYKFFKSKYGEPEAISAEKKKVVPKKAPFKKREKAKPIEEELKEREVEEIKSKKQEEKGEVPKRKIKRKL